MAKGIPSAPYDLQRDNTLKIGTRLLVGAGMPTFGIKVNDLTLIEAARLGQVISTMRQTASITPGKNSAPYAFVNVSGTQCDANAVWSRLQMEGFELSPKQWDNHDDKADFSLAPARPSTASASRQPSLPLTVVNKGNMAVYVVYDQHERRTKFDKSVKSDTFGNVDGPEYASSCVSHVAWSPLPSLCDAQQVPAAHVGSVVAALSVRQACSGCVAVLCLASITPYVAQWLRAGQHTPLHMRPEPRDALAECLGCLYAGMLWLSGCAQAQVTLHIQKSWLRACLHAPLHMHA
jgi:hypothetical protein